MFQNELSTKSRWVTHILWINLCTSFPIILYFPHLQGVYSVNKVIHIIHIFRHILQKYELILWKWNNYSWNYVKLIHLYPFLSIISFIWHILQKLSTKLFTLLTVFFPFFSLQNCIKCNFSSFFWPLFWVLHIFPQSYSHFVDNHVINFCTLPLFPLFSLAQAVHKLINFIHNPIL